MDVENDKDACDFKDLLDEAGLQQHVTVPTHRSGHTLDLIGSRKDVDLVTNVRTQQGLPSDHYIVLCSLNFDRPPAVKETLRYRKMREIDIEKFSDDIKSSVRGHMVMLLSS